MYKIDKTDYGFKLTFGGNLTSDELTNWKEDSKKALQGVSGRFGAMIDMRQMAPLTKEAQPIMAEGQKLYKSKGLERSAVILASPILVIQFKRIAKETGIYDWERYIDATSAPNWEKMGQDWLIKRVDPDKKPVTA